MGIMDKAKDFLSSDKGEEYSDKGLDAVAGAADRLTGGKHTDKIQGARDSVDERVGNDGAGNSGAAGDSASGAQAGEGAARTGDAERTAEAGGSGTGDAETGTTDQGPATDQR
ncbi:MAG: antitoxin [Actinomycetaceae bacterium]